MNTQRSEKKASEFLKSGQPFQRKVQTYEKTFNFPPAKVFQQFCPTRECDWIDGWDCKLIYTSTGYMEPNCIFSTDESNLLGPGLWILTRYEPNERLEAVRIIEDSLVEHFWIDLKDNQNGTSTGIWTLIFTALNQKGNTILADMPDENPDLANAIAGLEYFLKNSEMMPIVNAH